eukprot:scaffold6446_cov104-Isochrysis_galbana.AAC.3
MASFRPRSDAQTSRRWTPSHGPPPRAAPVPCDAEHQARHRVDETDEAVHLARLVRVRDALLDEPRAERSSPRVGGGDVDGVGAEEDARLRMAKRGRAAGWVGAVKMRCGRVDQRDWGGSDNKGRNASV